MAVLHRCLCSGYGKIKDRLEGDTAVIGLESLLKNAPTESPKRGIIHLMATESGEEEKEKVEVRPPKLLRERSRTFVELKEMWKVEKKGSDDEKNIKPASAADSQKAVKTYRGKHEERGAVSKRPEGRKSAVTAPTLLVIHEDSAVTYTSSSAMSQSGEGSSSTATTATSSATKDGHSQSERGSRVARERGAAAQASKSLEPPAVEPKTREVANE